MNASTISSGCVVHSSHRAGNILGKSPPSSNYQKNACNYTITSTATINNPLSSMLGSKVAVKHIYCSLSGSLIHPQKFIAGSLEAAYSLNWGAREIWGKGGGETLALL